MNEKDAASLFVVPAERHVERLAREGLRAETRASLRSRLVAGLLPDLAFADTRTSRLALAMALAEDDGGSVRAGQLGLFGGGGASPPVGGKTPAGDPLVRSVRERGGGSWARMIGALDDAIGVLRARGATIEHLDRVARGSGFVATRAHTLAAAMRALDARLQRTSTLDERLAGALLADAIRAAKPVDVEELVGARRLRSRWLLAWEPADVAWWRALDDVLSPRGGGARVVLPVFDRPIEGTRERDALDVLAEEISRGLDAPTESEVIAPVLGDLAGGAAGIDPAAGRVRIVPTNDVLAQADAVTSIVEAALARGVPVEKVAVIAPSYDERTLAPLRRAFDARGIVFHESRGAPPAEAPVVVAALGALEAASSLERTAVARLLRSGWVDAPRLFAGERRDAGASLSRLARSLEVSATVAGPDPVARLLGTATAETEAARARGTKRDATAIEHEVDLARRIVDALARARAATTRAEHVLAARTLWTELGIGSRAGRGGLAAFASDAVPEGVPRAERLAIARDARAWEALVSSLDLYESTARRADALAQPIAAETFRLELQDLLEGSAAQPGAGRAAAVRILRLGEAPGDDLALAIVVDASLGVLPRDDTGDALVSEPVEAALARESKGGYVPSAPGLARARDLASLAIVAADAGHVVFAYPREDANGATGAASPIVDALERAGIAPSPSTERAGQASSEPDIAALADIERRASRERVREGFFLDPARPKSALVGDLAVSAEAHALLTAETGGGDRALAVTGLERFARCPFMGFAQVVLAARESESRDELPDAREEGTLVHEALAAAFTATEALWPRRPRDAEAILSKGLEATTGVLDRWQGHAPLRAVVRLRITESVRAVLASAIEDDEWDFMSAEQAFGRMGRRAEGAAAWPPLVVTEGEATITLRGSIDRVDRAHDGRSARVVDYKRSVSTVKDSTRDLGGTALQVPIYACIAARALGVPATGVYAPTQARDVTVAKRDAKGAERMSELVSRAAPNELAPIESRALLVVMEARGGRLAPTPADETECRLCDVSGGCRKPRFAMEPIEEVGED
ncbi:MAG: PD-(D/E)XK nuclease family protein [Deltaproteobacteria bacterium]|nr:PD-(D/E)XK nuclease family protein [Deltaproteobacteria bacterium]